MIISDKNIPLAHKDKFRCAEITSDLFQNEIDQKNTHKKYYEPIISQKIITNILQDKLNAEDSKFTICLTHDVDDIYIQRIHRIANAVHHTCRGHPIEAAKDIFTRYSTKESNPFWSFKNILDLEKKYDASSAFYIMATDKDILRIYQTEDLSTELGNILDNGCEVGLHGGYYSYNDLNAILSEKQRLERIINSKLYGYRNHYLRFEYPLTLELVNKAGFVYDTTLGYNYSIGFRNGLCHCFKPYNINTDSDMDIIEIPMAIMDCALFTFTKDYTVAWDLTKKIMDNVAELNGILCVNWHTNNYNCPFRGNYYGIYEKILEYGLRKNAIMTAPINMINQLKS